MMNSFKDILRAAKQGGVKRLLIPSPAAKDLPLLAEATAGGLIAPCLVGDGRMIKTLIGGSPLDGGKCEILEENDARRVLGRAISHLRAGHADILMQGGIAHQELMDAVLDKNSGLKTGRVASYVSLFELLKRDKLILITDTYLNNCPGIAEKQAILENALQLARRLGMEQPKTAVLAAIEQVNPGIPSTLDAAILSKMAERRQFGNAVVEGPLDIDCALSQVAAERKGLKSIVTGNVDIYLVPEIDTGHLLAEALVFFGHMQTAGVVMGTSNPVILKMPFVSDENRIVEIALASLLCGKGGRNG
jgi:phosphate butyryltransferase